MAQETIELFNDDCERSVETDSRVFRFVFAHLFDVLLD
jgi:hypothetical protein